MTFRGSPLTRIFDPSASPFDISFPANTNPQPGLNVGTPIPLPEVFRNRTGFLRGSMRLNPLGAADEATYLFYGTDELGAIADQIGSERVSFDDVVSISSVGFWVFLQNRFAGIRIDVDFGGSNQADFDFLGTIQVV